MASIVTSREGPTGAEMPGLYQGMCLSQSEFHKLYEECPPGQKFELLDGVVYMAAAQHRPHGRFEPLLASMLMHYQMKTPGVEVLQHTSTIMDEWNEPQPDLQLRIQSEYGGTSSVDSDEDIAGAPELVIEVAHSSVSIDLKVKRKIYEKQGVREYIVVCIDAEELRWFIMDHGERDLDADGILRSDQFPGLWFDSAALFEYRPHDVMKTLNRGLRTRRHALFAAELKARRRDKN